MTSSKQTLDFLKETSVCLGTPTPKTRHHQPDSSKLSTVPLQHHCFTQQNHYCHIWYRTTICTQNYKSGVYFTPELQIADKRPRSVTLVSRVKKQVEEHRVYELSKADIRIEITKFFDN